MIARAVPIIFKILTTVLWNSCQNVRIYVHWFIKKFEIFFWKSILKKSAYSFNSGVVIFEIVPLLLVYTLTFTGEGAVMSGDQFWQKLMCNCRTSIIVDFVQTSSERNEIFKNANVGAIFVKISTYLLP